MVEAFSLVTQLVWVTHMCSVLEHFPLTSVHSKQQVVRLALWPHTQTKGERE